MTDESGWGDSDGGDESDGGEESIDLFDEETGGDGDEIDDPFSRLGEDVPGGDADSTGFAAADPAADDLTADDPAANDPAADDPAADDADSLDRGKTEDDGDAFGPRSATDAGQTGSSDPFDELGPATGESDADLEDAFERMDVGVAEEDAWESLDEDAGGEFGPGGGASERGATGAGFAADSARAGVDRVISKRTYCQQCPHFSAPPEVACGHEGTTILEAVGFDEFRVRNCPMVDDDDSGLDDGPGLDDGDRGSDRDFET